MRRRWFLLAGWWVVLWGWIGACACPADTSNKAKTANKIDAGTHLAAKVNVEKLVVPKPPVGHKVLIVNVFDESGNGISKAEVEATCPSTKRFEAVQLTEGLYYIVLPEECFTGGYVTASKPEEGRLAQTKVLSFERTSLNFVLIKR